MALFTALAVAAVAALVPTASAASGSYSLVKDYSGKTFFDDWVFYGNYDNLTNGDVTFVNRSLATSEQLAYVNDAGNAIIKVDDTTTVPWNYKRDTVRIATADQYSLGSLWVVDMTHIPYGCSVWPAYWSQAAVWPQGGEIDILEGVNLQTVNEMALHTDNGCSMTGQVQTGTLSSTNCSYEYNSNQGCQVADPSTSSYGEAFAKAGGGVWVTEFSTSAINIWYFNRSSVPSSLSGNESSLSTSDFGTPTANYPSTDCNMEKYFAPQTIIFDITLCGDWAGANATFQQTCSGTCYNDYVIGNASYYNTAYFEIGYLRIYGNGTDVVVAGTSDSSSSGTSTSSASSGTSTSSSSSSSSAASPFAQALSFGAALAAGSAAIAAAVL